MIEKPDDQVYLVDLADGILRLTFNRPEFGNALPSTALPMLERLFRAAQADPAIRCILIAGDGGVFSAGGDLLGFAQSIEQEVEARRASFARRLAVVGRLVQAIVGFDRPIVAAIRGAATDGSALYFGCRCGDWRRKRCVRVRSSGRWPQSRWRGSLLLPRVVGDRTARTLLLTAARLDAAEAHRLGTLSRIVASDDLAGESAQLARRLAQAPQRAIVAAKRLVSASSSSSLAEQLAAESAAIVACVGDPDFGEGVRAFLEKRRPVFPSAV